MQKSVKFYRFLNFYCKNISELQNFIYICREEPFHHTCYMLCRLVREHRSAFFI